MTICAVHVMARMLWNRDFESKPQSVQLGPLVQLGAAGTVAQNPMGAFQSGCPSILWRIWDEIASWEGEIVYGGRRPLRGDFFIGALQGVDMEARGRMMHLGQRMMLRFWRQLRDRWQHHGQPVQYAEHNSNEKTESQSLSIA